MQILLHELKKIFTWKIILLLIFVNIILFFLLIEFYIKHFPNGRPALDSYNIGVEMVEKYGTHMDEEDFNDFVQIYASKVEEADKYLQSREEFVTANLDSYEKLRQIQHDNKEGNMLYNKLMFDEQVDLFWELQERERLIEFHEMKEIGLEAYSNDANNEQRARFNEMLEKGQYQVYPEVVMENYKSFITNVAIAIIISIVLVISPIFIKDRLRQLLDLQYTMKKGRCLYKTKIAAGFISTFIVITTLLIIYFYFYSHNNTSMFLKVPIHMFIGDFYWYDLTFFQYILLTIIAIYILGFIFTLLAMSFSSIMPNYITLIGIQIPLVIAMIAYGFPYLMNRIISLFVSKWIVPTTYIVMILVSVAFIVLLWNREKKRDILI